jgi:hypothetical protein
MTINRLKFQTPISPDGGTYRVSEQRVFVAQTPEATQAFGKASNTQRLNNQRILQDRNRVF